MAASQTILNLRPQFSDEFDVQGFTPRTPAITDAYNWGQEMHAGHLRFSGEPYFETHCVWVAGFLDNLVHNEAWTIAALLHDSVEDRGGSLDQIMKRFPGKLGEEVAFIVDGVTKLSAPRDGWSRELESLRKLTMHRDPGVFLVKLADKSHNVLTLKHMPDENKRQQKATEAIRAYGKLAGILNCYQWRRWLEDMAFPFADPDTYAYVRSRIDADPRLSPEFLNKIVVDLAGIMEKNNIPGRVEITVNGYWQAWQKLRRQALQRVTSLSSFTGLNDMVSFRMILDTFDERECYALLASLNRYLGPYLDQNRFDDYIACPQNGYRALQATAYMPGMGAVEVAIMTNEMEGENRWGIVYAIQQGKEIENYRPMAILTPSGGVRFLPEASTVLDAVASIQQESLLDKISEVEVNGKPARISDRVNAGDIVEVITGPNRLIPSEEWLSYCNQATARTLRSLLITGSLRKSAEQGRLAIRMILKEHGVMSLEDVQALEIVKLDNLLEILGCASLEDLYIGVGGGAIRLQDLNKALEQVGIDRKELNWTTIHIVGSKNSNKPGVLASLTALVSRSHGNIIRSVTNTLPSGDFELTILAANMDEKRRMSLTRAYQCCGLDLKWFEII